MLVHVRRALFLLLLICSNAHAEIIDAKTIDEVYKHFDRSSSKSASLHTLGVFDVDKVLFTPGLAAFQIPNIKNYSEILTKMLSTLNNKQKDILNNLVSSNSRPVLVDRKDPQIIRKIEDKGVKLIALTTLLTGEVDNISNYESWRYLSLKHFDIDFSKSFPDFQQIIFNDVPSYCDRFPVFYKGILNANGAGRVENSKGDILIKFLQKVKFTPQKIIFVSDSVEDLLAVEKSFKAFDSKIKFLAIYYSAAESYPIIPIEEEDFVKSWERFIERAKHLSKKAIK